MTSPPSSNTSPLADPKGTIIYIHGGGLIFGQPHDLPPEYVSAFNTAGYNLLAPNYPKAPKHTLPATLDSMEASIQAYADQGELRGDRSIYFGRSAGAFLATQLIARRIAIGNPVPDALISLYGYADTTFTEFHSPSPHYSTFGPIPEGLSDQATLPDDRPDQRFLYYIAHRQRGTWPKVVLGAAADSNAVIPAEKLSQFPPTFLAASVHDPDVPFAASEALAATIPAARLLRLDVPGEHDIDRDPTGPYGLTLYREIIAWLKELE